MQFISQKDYTGINIRYISASRMILYSLDINEWNLSCVEAEQIHTLYINSYFDTQLTQNKHPTNKS